jgi:hypothetical protein
MSFREKIAWTSLISLAAVFGWYFWILAQQLLSGTLHADGTIGLFIFCVVLVVVLHIVGAIAAAISAPKQANAAADEREKLIDLRAHRFSAVVLGAGVLTTALCGPFFVVWGHALQGVDPAIAVAGLMSNAILAAMVLAELVYAAGQIVQFRRGI